MMQEQEPNNSNLWKGLALLMPLLLLGLFFRRFSVLILLVLSVGTLIGILFYFIRYVLKANKRRAMKNTLEGKIEAHRRECTSQIEKHRTEIEEIQRNILELDDQLNIGQQVNPKTQEESHRILAGFRREQQLRETKITFYTTCRAKLENMLFNHRLAKELEEKQKKLSQLQEEHHQDLARMEQLRTEVEYEKRFLDSIGQLSMRMAGINSLDTAEELQLELQEITKELRRL